ncbi:YciI family protein [Hirschia baltica]|uniref:YCII-related n=1 Tax=Hirschia baltica (strain ATCC 49814 / DSM 5838 / IFAM 1418) TaxID=582402 RepID=C6XKI0_HIRBI|nr:YciI family protein [Hirschia baltica]ACT57778.1 YCII-related [Hirschia baltica ATCC 49814]
MAYFSIYAMDRRPDGPTIRAETRPAHLEYLRRLGDVVKLAGPVMAHDGETVAGSLVVIEADDIDAAHQIAADDPYAKAGLFCSSDVRAYKWVINPPE